MVGIVAVASHCVALDVVTADAVVDMGTIVVAAVADIAGGTAVAANLDDDVQHR